MAWPPHQEGVTGPHRQEEPVLETSEPSEPPGGLWDTCWDVVVPPCKASGRSLLQSGAPRPQPGLQPLPGLALAFSCTSATSTASRLSEFREAHCRAHHKSCSKEADRVPRSGFSSAEVGGVPLGHGPGSSSPSAGVLGVRGGRADHNGDEVGGGQTSGSPGCQCLPLVPRGGGPLDTRFSLLSPRGSRAREGPGGSVGGTGGQGLWRRCSRISRTCKSKEEGSADMDPGVISLALWAAGGEPGVIFPWSGEANSLLGGPACG